MLVNIYFVPWSMSIRARAKARSRARNIISVPDFYGNERRTMQISAKLIRADISAQKARLVADQVRGLSAGAAVELLRFSQKNAAKLVKKVVDSAIANAEHNAGLDSDELVVKTIFVDEGPVMKRFHARARGRGCQILKRSCHITVIVSDKNNLE